MMESRYDRPRPGLSAGCHKIICLLKKILSHPASVLSKWFIVMLRGAATA